VHEKPSGTVCLAPGAFGDGRRQITGLHSRRPDDRLGRVRPRRLGVDILHRDDVVGDVGDHGTGDDVDARLLELRAGVRAELAAECGQNFLDSVDEGDRDVARVDVRERAGEIAVREIPDLAGQFDTRRACTDDDEAQQLLASGRIGCQVRSFVAAQDLLTQSDRVVDGLECERAVLELVAAEVRLRGTRGDDETTEADGVVLPGTDVGDLVSVGIDIDDASETHVGRLVLREDASDRRGDLARREHSGGGLIEQRLKEVFGGAGDQRERHTGLAQRLGGGQCSESRSHDDDVVRLHSTFLFGSSLSLYEELPP